jgi:putative hemolysin
MNTILIEILVLLLLIATNGVLAMAEIAVVSARKVRLQQRAEAGDSGSRTALNLANSPGRFLSTVQIGITLVGILAGAFSGATLAQEMEIYLAEIPGIGPFSEAISVGLIVLIITYLSLVLGELAPKRVALNNPERIAALVARPMNFLARLVAPFVSLLTKSTDFVVSILGTKPSQEPPITEEEIMRLIGLGTQFGVFEKIEHDVVDKVFRLGDRQVSSLMTPRTEIAWLDVKDPTEKLRQKVIASDHSYLPVAIDNLDKLLGFVKSRDVLAQCLQDQPLDIKAVLKPALFVPENTPAFYVLDRLKETRSEIAFVLGEFGGIQGLVTLRDILEAIVGDIPTAEQTHPDIVQREDGTFLLDGLLPIDEFREIFDLPELPGEAKNYYETLGGFVMTSLGHIPSVGEHFELSTLRIEVVDMDGYRVDKVLVERKASP